MSIITNKHVCVFIFSLRSIMFRSLFLEPIRKETTGLTFFFIVNFLKAIVWGPNHCIKHWHFEDVILKPVILQYAKFINIQLFFMHPSHILTNKKHGHPRLAWKNWINRVITTNTISEYCSLQANSQLLVIQTSTRT